MPTYVYRCPVHGEFEVEQKITDPKLEECPYHHWGVALRETTDYGSPEDNARWQSAKYHALVAPSAQSAARETLGHYANVYPTRTYEVVAVHDLLDAACGASIERLISSGTSFALKKVL
jgi:hypothetical protein